MTEVLTEHRPAIESALRDEIARASASGLPLYRMIQYQLGWVDQHGEQAGAPSAPRLIGALAMEAARSLSPDGPHGAAATCAAAAELFAESVAVHEDMQTAEPHADGRDAVWWIWGPAQAINVGDGLHAMARLALFHAQEQGLDVERTLAAISTLDTCALAYYEGQYLELTFQERVDITQDQYLKMAAGRRGALISLATGLGAHAAGASLEVAGAYRAFGERVGVALQLADDLQILSGGRPHGRALSKSKLFPVVHAIDIAPLAQKRELGAIYFKRVMEPADLETVRTTLTELGAIEATRQQIAVAAATARELLEQATNDQTAIERWSSVIDALVAPAMGETDA